MAAIGKYVYCFIKENKDLKLGVSELLGLKSPVYNIVFKDVSAIVSNAPMINCDPSRRNILAHQKVLSTAMESYTIVPVSFGTIARNKEDIEDLIELHYFDFWQALEYLEGKVELGLRINWNKNWFNQDIENERITMLKHRVSGKDEDEVMADKIRLGQLVEEVILRKRDEYQTKIFDPLSTLAVESKLSDKLSVKTVINSFFLVEKSKENEFDKAVEQLADEYSGKLDFSYLGPCPPYNFIDIRI